MRSCRLLVLVSLVTGCQASSEVKGCNEGWVEFTCSYPRRKTNYEYVGVDRPGRQFIKSTKVNMWENTDRKVSLYHDVKNEKLKVAVRQLQQNDFVEYTCIFCQRPPCEKQKVKLAEGCQEPFIQTAYRTARTTITCEDPGRRQRSRVLSVCKERSTVCDDILSTASTPKSNGSFTVTETSSGFDVSISDVSTDHAGVYWCTVTSGSNRAAFRKTELVVGRSTIKRFTRSLTIGQNYTYWCEYPVDAPADKFICKGEDPSRCEPVVSTAQSAMRVFMKDNTEKRNITITVREVTAGDAGTYWCGAQSTNPRYSDTFYHRFSMEVVIPRGTSPAPTTPATTAGSYGGSQIIIAVAVGVAVLLLLLLLLLLVLVSTGIYKPGSHSKHRRTGGAAQHVREDYVYEEIQEQVQRPGNAVSTIYASVNHPTNPPNSLHYSTIHFKNVPDQAGDEALILNSSSVCEYTAVKSNQRPTNCTVYQPFRASPDPLYSSVNKPRC